MLTLKNRYSPPPPARSTSPSCRPAKPTSALAQFPRQPLALGTAPSRRMELNSAAGIWLCSFLFPSILQLVNLSLHVSCLRNSPSVVETCSGKKQGRKTFGARWGSACVLIYLSKAFLGLLQCRKGGKRGKDTDWHSVRLQGVKDQWHWRALWHASVGDTPAFPPLFLLAFSCHNKDDCFFQD